MIIVGLAFAVLLVLALCGRPSGDKAPIDGRLGALLFILLLVGIVARKHASKKDDEDF